MSRSYGKPVHPFHLMFMDELEELKRDIYSVHWNWNYFNNFNRIPSRHFENWNDVKDIKWRYYAKKHTCHRHSHRFPKDYRKLINKERRNLDKRELYKEVNFKEYDGKYSKWNCKDSDPWWYW